MAKFCKTAKQLWPWHEAITLVDGMVNAIRSARSRPFDWSKQARKKKEEDSKKGGANNAHQKAETAHAKFRTLPASPSFGGSLREPPKSGLG